MERTTERAAARPFARPVLALALVLAAAGCSTTGADPDKDPYESWNRKVFAFNLGAKEYVLDPVARGWRAVLPDPVERAISRFFDNLESPIDILNNLLQGKPLVAGGQALRFVVNSTVGVAGFFDPATSWGLQSREEDFGQTLAVWGVPSGPYLMLPLWGPSSPREGIGLIGDAFTSLQPYFLDTATTYALYGVDLVNDDAADLDAAKKRKEAAIDYYVFVRNAYLQHRQALIRDENTVPDSQQEDLYDVDSLYDEPE